MRRTITKFACNFATKKASLISFPVNLGQPLLGPDRSPQLLKENGLLPILKDLGWNINEAPDVISSFLTTSTNNTINDTPHAKNCAQVGEICEQIFKQVSEHAADKDNFLLILGGDHCIPIGTIPAIRKHRPSTGVVWVVRYILNTYIIYPIMHTL